MMITKSPAVNQSIKGCKFANLKIVEFLMKQKRSYNTSFIQLNIRQQQPLKRLQESIPLSTEDAVMKNPCILRIRKGELSFTRNFILQIIQETWSFY